MPAAMPIILSGFKLSLGLGLLGVVALVRGLGSATRQIRGCRRFLHIEVTVNQPAAWFP